ncbi:YwqG family protein [Anaerosporobacter sp.]|uniref:YwqG family protein n=1 Tax=Anaerosporobacter sp. TaxID=1872529 RepID=UPI00286F3C02|nr:YwqG family protein [Anaerosporobacter sp.]
MMKSIELTARRGKVALTDSKFGGKPYFTKNLEYPCNKKGIPLRLLAQFNFSKLPKLDNFPQKGILQFFIAEEDYGLDFDTPPEIQNNFRVIYHENVLSVDETNQDIPEFVGEEFPFWGEFALNAECKSCFMTECDFRFDKEFMKVYRKYIITQAESIYDLDDEIVEEICKEFCTEGHRIGGYPYFTQTDPRGYEGGYGTHTITLFQMGSDMSNHENEIMWGDCGVANFFISPKDLEKLDFSDVLYNWDCC